MSRRTYAILAGLLAAITLGLVAHAQQPALPGGHQSMFIVTSAGVIATDPIGYGT